MAEVTRGKRKGQQVVLHQWANNWFSVDYADGTTGIVSPVSLRLTEMEVVAWSKKPTGMDREFVLTPERTFKRRPRTRR